jgi:hypothetical protein
VTEPRRDDEPLLPPPPEGATCHEHPESFAVVTCPRCGNYACLSCWHDPIVRCHACLLRDPLAAGDPIPWEDDRRSFGARLLRTFTSALSPARSAPGFGRGGIAPAVTFGLLSFVPLALLAGIVTFTATLLFEPVLAWRTIGSPTDAEVAIDVAKAAGLGLLVWSAQALVLGTAYASLVGAYLTKGHPPASARAVLYRAWLLPLTSLIMHVGGWLAPSAEVASILETLGIVPLMLLMSALVATARMGGGVGRFTSFVVVMVPVAVMLGSQFFLLRALAPILPDSEAIAAAARASEAADVASEPPTAVEPAAAP